MAFIGPLIEALLPWLGKLLSFMGWKQEQIQAYLTRVRTAVGTAPPTQPVSEEEAAKKDLENQANASKPTPPTSPQA